MKVRFDQIHRFFTHLAIWLFYLLYESSILLIIDNVHLNFWETGLSFAIYAAVFYANSLYIFPRVFNRRKYGYLLLIPCLIGIVILLRYALHWYVLPHLDNQVLHPFTTHKRFLAQSIWRGGYYTLLSLGYFFAINSLYIEKQRRKLSEAKAERQDKLREAEKALMQAEISNLKSQINPHFLYNALNFFYSQIYPLSERTANGILLLSDIMRYALKDDLVNGKVMLEDEVEHLQNYIRMNQLRFDNQLQVDFTVEGSLAYRMIIPLILITFVENCFKHGDLYDSGHPLTIRLRVSDDQLSFYTYNKKQRGIKPRSTGVGLTNTRRRLDLCYGDRYSLDLSDEGDFFACTLIINL